jgi:iron complex outermembrane receptor protein
MLSSNLLRRAVHNALMGGAVAAASTAGMSLADAQTTDAAGKPLEEVVVTGTRIRRVDTETASPVFTLGAEQIKQSGVQTLGDLIQQIPSISGAASNPQVNNGGGTGASYVELRGLDAERTLLLLNGRRIGILGYSFDAVDVNMIPVNMIERVEVLKEGAGAIYGSDAIAGVVNIITYSKLDGGEVGIDYGVTGKNDGKHRSFSLSYGASGDKSNMLIGVNYNKQEAVSAGDREFSKYALYLYNAAVYGVSKGGSSRTPNGRISLPSVDSAGNPVPGSLQAQFGCSSVTRKAGATGSSLSDYRCFTSADLYNYQPLNLLMTPQERASVFTSGNYEINDSITAYTQILYSRTHSGYQIAALPFDSRADDVIVSGQSMYNPFHIDFGGISAVNPNALWRLEQLGTRSDEVVTAAEQVNAGLKGKVLDTSWQWDANAAYSRMDQDYKYSGYVYLPKLIAGLGPSMNINGIPTCVQSTSPSSPLYKVPIAGCTPIDIFNLSSQPSVLAELKAPYTQNYTYRTQEATVNFNGNLFKLPGGDVKAGVGYEYHKLSNSFFTDYVSQAVAPLYLTCLIASEACSASSGDQYHVSEIYAELFIPILKDLPGIKALNVSGGTRYSKYSTFGSTTNSTFKVEYRPISDVLIRGSYAEVFRAPTLYNLSHGPSHDAPTFNDPCTGLTAANVAANHNYSLACQNVPTNGTFAEDNGQVDGLKTSTSNLKPETGHVLTYGVIYEPSWVPNFSTDIDVWKYRINNLITEVDPNYAADQCVATGAAEFCSLINRNSDGTILEILEPFKNLGVLETDGVDVGFKYSLPSTPVGAFRFSLDTTYIANYKNTPAPGAQTIQVAGTYDRQFGNYARWRGMLSVGWALQGFDAMITTRYIHSLVLHDPDGFPGIQPDLQIPSIVYWNGSVGYSFPTQTKVQFTIDNAFDKDPPILYQNNVLNANTDVSTYDTLGRRFSMAITQKF